MEIPEFVKIPLPDEDLDALDEVGAKAHIRKVEAEMKLCQSNYNKEVFNNFKYFQQVKKSNNDLIVAQTQVKAVNRQLKEFKQLAEDRRVGIQWYQKRYGIPERNIRPKLNLFQRLVAKLIRI
ncbi:hypothetical protein J5I95_18195 [Candidatus Poribacteria bacterium]|nr:hypothetical protein [Candidatus Poribacteria bacterium]